MSPDLAKRIVATLRIGAPAEEAAEQVKNFRPRDWGETLTWMRRGGIALYWWSRMKQIGAASVVPKHIGLSLNKDAEDNQVRVEVMAEEFQSLVNMFERKRVPYAVLKGFALTPEYCSDPALRTQYDFDFLVLPKSLGTAESLLLNAGFIRKHHRSGAEPIEYFHSQRRPILPVNLDRVFSADLYRTVEIHTRLWDSNAEHIPLAVPEDSLSRIIPKTWNGIAFQALSRAEALLFQALHIFRHILNNQCRLSHLLELATFFSELREHDSIWGDFERLIQRDKYLKEVAGVVFSLSSELFEVHLSREIRASTTDQLSFAAEFWVHRYGLSSGLQNFTGSKSSLHLHRLFIDDVRDWRYISQRKLFPIHRLSGITRRFRTSPAFPGVSQLGQIIRVVRRGWFHVAAALQYAWGLFEWRHVWQARSGRPALRRADIPARRADLTETDLAGAE